MKSSCYFSFLYYVNLNIVWMPEGTGLKFIYSWDAANSGWSLGLLNDESQTEQFYRASKINNYLNLNTGYFNNKQYFHFAKAISMQRKQFISESVFSLLCPQKTWLHTWILFRVPVYLQFEYTVLMLNELINSGQVSTWLHTVKLLSL